MIELNMILCQTVTTLMVIFVVISIDQEDHVECLCRPLYIFCLDHSQAPPRFEMSIVYRQSKDFLFKVCTPSLVSGTAKSRQPDNT